MTCLVPILTLLPQLWLWLWSQWWLLLLLWLLSLWFVVVIIVDGSQPHPFLEGDLVLYVKYFFTHIIIAWIV